MKLLVTGAWHDAERYIPLLKQRGHEIAFLQYETDELPCAPEWAEGVVCNGLFLRHDARQFRSLRYVQLTSAGFDRVPAAYFREKGLALHNARGVYSIPMAEYATAAVLNVYRSSRRFWEYQQQRRWEKLRDLRELSGSRVCILGCGSVGTECAKRFGAMGCEVIGVDLLTDDRDHFRKIYHTDEIENAISGADAVIVTLPLTEQTKGLADERFFSLLKDGCVLVNIARGGILCTDALVHALRKRELFAVLDVFEEEPLDRNSPLWEMENVLITPHNSFVSDKTADRLSALILKNLEEYGENTDEDPDHIPQK